MTQAPDFSKMVPGFDFLQGLVKNAGAALPNIGQWVAPTLDPEELDKRIQELRTVQFWLEQNGRMLGATIQALEVQRMTLSTLKTMNVQMGDLRDALTIKPPAMPERRTAPPEPAIKPAPEPAAAAPEPSAAASDPQVDPMQWWSALTKQFTEVATQAMRDAGNVAAQGVEQTKAAAAAAQSVVAEVAKAAPIKPAAKTAAKTAATKSGTAKRAR